MKAASFDAAKRALIVGRAPEHDTPQ